MQPEQPVTPTNPPETTPTPVEQAPIAPTPVTPVGPAPVATPPKKKFPLWLKIVLGLVGLLVAGIVALVIFVNIAAGAPQKVSDAFINDIQAKNVSAAYAATSPEFQKATSEARLTSLINQINPHVVGEEKVTGKKVQTKNGVNTAAIVYSIANEQDKTVYVRITLVEKEGDWKVLGLKSSEEALEAEIE